MEMWVLDFLHFEQVSAFMVFKVLSNLFWVVNFQPLQPLSQLLH